MKNTWMKKLMGLTLVLGMGTGLQGCSEEDVIAGLGLIAIGAGAIIIADEIDDNDHRRRRCRGGYVRRCTTYTDYWGDRRRECRRVWDSCKYYEYYSNSPALMSHLSSQENLEKAEVEPSKFASVFSISFEASESFVSALEQAREGNSEDLIALGLNKDDITQLVHEKMPSAEGIDALALTLGADKAATKAMLSRLLIEGKKLKKKTCKPRARGHHRGPRFCRAI
jgi:hypothetical protein